MEIEIDRIKNKVATAQLDEAVELLIQGTKNTDFEIEGVLIGAKYQRWKGEKRKGLTDEAFEQLSFNKIIIEIIELLNEIVTKFLHDDVVYEEVKFFETSRQELANISDREYSKKFKKGLTRHIGWELSLSTRRLKTDFSNLIKWYIKKPNNQFTPKYSTEFHFERGWSNPWISASWGKNAQGELDIGRYEIFFEIRNKVVFTGEFYIIE